MNEDQAKEMYFELMDLLAVAAMNQSNNEYDFIDELNKNGYDI